MRSGARDAVPGAEQRPGTQAQWQPRGKRAAAQGAEESSAPQARCI
jgi:hypothetical protein